MSVLDEVGLHRKAGETPLVACRDTEMADSFDDFLTQHCDDVFFVKFEDEGMVFSFRQDADVTEIDRLMGIFLVGYNK